MNNGKIEIVDVVGFGALIFQNSQQNKQLDRITTQDKLLTEIIERLERIEKGVNYGNIKK